MIALTGTSEGHLWRFCTTSEVVNTVISGLKCYVNDTYASEEIKQAIELLLPGIEASSDTLMASAAVYAGSDCDVVEETFFDNLTDGMAASE